MVGFQLRSLGCSSRSLNYYPSNITANWKQLGQAQSNEEPRDRKDSSGTYAPRHQPSAQRPPKSRKMKECVIWAVHTWRKEAAGRGGWALSVQAPHTVRQPGVLEAQHQHLDSSPLDILEKTRRAWGQPARTVAYEHLSVGTEAGQTSRNTSSTHAAK